MQDGIAGVMWVNRVYLGMQIRKCLVMGLVAYIT